MKRLFLTTIIHRPSFVHKLVFTSTAGFEASLDNGILV